jgi:energy-converting hydrogenase B subunit D
VLDLLAFLAAIGVVTSAILAVALRNVTAAAVCAGVCGLAASIMYLLLAAPDAAMAEAAIGAGLTTVVLLYAIHKTGAGRT